MLPPKLGFPWSKLVQYKGQIVVASANSAYIYVTEQVSSVHWSLQEVQNILGTM